MISTFQEWRRSHPQLVWAAPVFLLITGGLALFYLLVLRTDYVVLAEDLRPTEAAAIVRLLDSESVAYQLTDFGRAVMVPEDRVSAARLLVFGGELPVAGANGFELFDESDMGLTDFAQKIKYQRALQGELTRTLMRMEGVEDARVHISMSQQSLFRGDQQPASAAVTLTMRRGYELTAEQIAGVQSLVAAAVSSLSEHDVVVLNVRGQVVSVQTPAISGDNTDDIELLATSAEAFSDGSDLPAAIAAASDPGDAYQTNEDLSPLDGEAELTPTPVDGSLHPLDLNGLEPGQQADGSSELEQARSLSASIWSMLGAVLSICVGVVALGVLARRLWLGPELQPDEHEALVEQIRLALAPNAAPGLLSAAVTRFATVRMADRRAVRRGLQEWERQMLQSALSNEPPHVLGAAPVQPLGKAGALSDALHTRVQTLLESDAPLALQAALKAYLAPQETLSSAKAEAAR